MTGAQPGAGLTLRLDDLEWATTADELGNALWRDVTSGAGYTVIETTAAGVATSDPFEIRGLTDHPATAFYADQVIEPGYGYLATRDGTQLSINVTLPGPVEDGPYPTVIEYSGYDPSDPESVEPATGVAQQAGFATVGVNIARQRLFGRARSTTSSPSNHSTATTPSRPSPPSLGCSGTRSA